MCCVFDTYLNDFKDNIIKGLGCCVLLKSAHSEDPRKINSNKNRNRMLR